ncbi:DUF3566 domain-containing protein [Blastococcus sp. TF02A-35]|uniref:DUF3566 domain-containing protein n=1 Tax=Blastococcus sp. TF02A-35 TaxID=2559612 RepID=UPI0010746684|nr:DUF3566 domain-containing protein [Blastococcus sp. TF02A_35]TFV43987.1 DUF3566 domain-containing protein [Blastococcus sp. TF02A_35]
MSDRTQGSVRTDSRDEAGPATTGPAPASATQSVPATGAQRAVAPGTGSVPLVPQPLTGETPAVPTGSAAGGTPAGGSAAGAAAPSGTTRPGAKTVGRGPRRARLQLRHIDTWSALKMSLMLSIALFFIWMVAVAILYGVLNGLGVFDTLNGLIGQLGTSEPGGNGDVFTIGVVAWGAAVIGAINVVLLTALCTVGTYIYNLFADLVGGLEVTLSERD